MDDLATLRRRLDAVARQVDGGPNGGRPGAAVRVGKVLDGGSMPATVPGMFLLKPQRIGGTESEGSALANADDGPPFVALVLGPRVPAVGDLLVARLIGGRWVAETKQAAGGGGISVPGCTCASMPATLTMTVTNSALSYGMLQTCTLQWGATPAAYARLSLGASCYLSTASFSDQSTPDLFRYYFACLGGYYILTRVYETSVYSSPYRDTIRYKWLVGNAGNSCSPFALTNGQIYPGGDPLCTAKIA